jgi:hypothetical protein
MFPHEFLAKLTNACSMAWTNRCDHKPIDPQISREKISVPRNPRARSLASLG